MDSDWVYRAEYSLSDRSFCKKCGNGIGKDVVRLAIMQQSRFHDGKDCLWHHVHCFFQKKHNVNVNEIWHFHNLRWKDQERIRQKAEGKIKGKKAADSSEESGETEEDDEEEQAKTKSKRGKRQGGSRKKKATKQTKTEAGMNEEMVALKEQNERIWAARDELAQLPAKAQKELLEANEQHVPVANKIMDRCVDMLLFGPTEKCDQCTRNGHLVISADGYHCIGSVNEWAKCDVKTQHPRRRVLLIPEKLLDKYSFLSQYTSFKATGRIFPSCFKLSQSNGTNGHALTKKEPVTNGTSDETDGPSTSEGITNAHAKAEPKTRTPPQKK